MSAWSSLFSGPTAAFTVAAQAAAQPLLPMPVGMGMGAGRGRGFGQMHRGGGPGGRGGGGGRGRGGGGGGGGGGGRGQMGSAGQKRRGEDGGEDGSGSKRARGDGPSETAAAKTVTIAPPPVILSPAEQAEVDSWIAARKARFPTRVAVEEKARVRAQAIERGEIVADQGRGRRGRGGRGGARDSGRDGARGRGGRGGRGGGGSGGRGGGFVRNGDRSDVEDEASDDDDAEDDIYGPPAIGPGPASTGAAAAAAASAAATAGSSTAATPAPAGGQNPNWKRALCQFERPGQPGCRRAASQCSFLHRGEPRPPRIDGPNARHHPSSIAAAAPIAPHGVSVTAKPVVAASAANSSSDQPMLAVPAAPIDGGDSVPAQSAPVLPSVIVDPTQTRLAKQPTVSASSSLSAADVLSPALLPSAPAASADSQEPDVAAAAVSAPTDANPIAATLAQAASLSAAAPAVSAAPSQEAQAASAPATQAVPTASVASPPTVLLPSDADSGTNPLLAAGLEAPALSPAPLAALSAASASRVLHAVRFLLRSGPLRLRTEEPMEE